MANDATAGADNFAYVYGSNNVIALMRSTFFLGGFGLSAAPLPPSFVAPAAAAALKQQPRASRATTRVPHVAGCPAAA